MNEIREAATTMFETSMPICPECGQPEYGWHEGTTGCEGHYFVAREEPIRFSLAKCPHCDELLQIKHFRGEWEYHQVEKY